MLCCWSFWQSFCCFPSLCRLESSMCFHYFIPLCCYVPMASQLIEALQGIKTADPRHHRRYNGIILAHPFGEMLFYFLSRTSHSIIFSSSLTTFPLPLCRGGQQAILKLLFNFSSVQRVSHHGSPTCCDSTYSKCLHSERFQMSKVAEWSGNMLPVKWWKTIHNILFPLEYYF